MLAAFFEKLFFGAAVLVASALGWTGAILSEGEWRWLCIAFTSSILMGTLVALIVKGPTDTMKVTIGRTGVAILVGTLGTREIVIQWGIQAFQGDAIRLAGWAAAMTLIGMTVGYPLILLLNTRGKSIARRWLERWSGKEGE
ncbi:hypothetical protein [Luteolibacter luteus]|uniref:Uncharacterized protein n=1 Tax=Luteolibacter luteus TaxID=2728835 RepID=A0A858RCA4_9BACT|nr:hypothetical protein [Luteolibacter luteus]QJE94234.1 hypothetical protein HHL09_00025 [Luteolibacter luteus]